VSDRSIDSQIASAAYPAAPERLLMASSCCERIRGTESRGNHGLRVEQTQEYLLQSSAKLIWSSSDAVSYLLVPVPWFPVT
jgi:hypothetical protein